MADPPLVFGVGSGRWARLDPGIERPAWCDRRVFLHRVETPMVTGRDPSTDPQRYAAIDIGTNSVLLLVAERREGRFAAVAERAEITRLGRGVDRTGALSPEGMEA